jgi:ectoine hydroxylase-related dioxygenase (phytanoyl-CoA dioxygenase family)
MLDERIGKMAASLAAQDGIRIWVALDDATPENGCMFFIPGSHKETTLKNTGITKNMDAVFDIYPQFKGSRSVPGTMKAGSCSFHNGLCIHGAGANMTPGPRRAMTCIYMPDGSTFNGVQNVLTDAQAAGLKVGDLLNDEGQNPLIYSR